MAKKRKSAAKRAAKKAPARRKRAGKRSPDDTVNALVILVVIVLVLAGCYLYFQKAKAEPLSLSPPMSTISTPTIAPEPK